MFPVILPVKLAFPLHIFSGKQRALPLQEVLLTSYGNGNTVQNIRCTRSPCLKSMVGWDETGIVKEGYQYGD